MDATATCDEEPDFVVSTLMQSKDSKIKLIVFIMTIIITQLTYRVTKKMRTEIKVE